jgi:hypothetical protein
LKASEERLLELEQESKAKEQAWEFERQNLTKALEQATALADRSSALPQMDSMPLFDTQVRAIPPSSILSVI